ncbi:hypothetical protein [Derxia gummosa]|uniref:Calcium-binding protein n=1 Tax=Derxia gummosa DSM 723 TaxID=1121388 RepID=A0A8B6X422_9BURK|nr:hypothetical protein [Derxia gummosa]
MYAVLHGGRGDDLLVSEGDGAELIAGTAGGNDRLVGHWGDDFRLSLDAGGQDRVSARGGVGHDSFHVFIAAGGGGRIDIDGGGGADVCAFDFLGAAGAPTGTVRLTGLGADDRIDLSGLLDTAAAAGGYQSGEPFAGGWFALVARGADTVLRFDADGAAGDAHGWIDIATLVGLAPAQIGAGMFITDHGADGLFAI